MIERIAYQCEHCKKHKLTPKIFLDKERMRIHEVKCYYNPKNKTCMTCTHNNYWDRTNHCLIDIDIPYPEDSQLKETEGRLPEVNCEHWTDEIDKEEDEEDETNFI